MFIEDGTGNGFKQKVDKNFRSHVKAFIVSEAHAISADELNGFSLLAIDTVPQSELKMMLITNTHETKVLVVNRIRMSTIGVAAAAVGALWNVYIGGAFSSGGTDVTPINLHVGASPTATGTFKDSTASTIVTSGTLTSVHKNYIANDFLQLEMDRMIILPRNTTLTISFTGSTAAGTAVVECDFYYDATEVVQ